MFELQKQLFDAWPTVRAVSFRIDYIRDPRAAAILNFIAVFTCGFKLETGPERISKDNEQQLADLQKFVDELIITRPYGLTDVYD